MIQLNNEKRALLNEENEQKYDDMLIYIRLTSNKSEQQTEEILLELLDHLIAAQESDKNAEDIFGADLKAYCDEIIDALPQEKWKKTTLFFIYIGFKMISFYLMSFGGLGYVISLFGIRDGSVTFSVGKLFTLFILLLATFGILIFFMMRWITNSLFRKTRKNKLKDFFALFLMGACIGLPFILSLFLLPDFGNKVTLPVFVLLILGICLYCLNIILNKKYRLI